MFILVNFEILFFIFNIEYLDRQLSKQKSNSSKKLKTNAEKNFSAVNIPIFSNQIFLDFSAY